MTDFVQEKTFFDDKNYPHGFARSGDYNIKEADVLSTYGQRLYRLAEELVAPTNEVEEHFVAVVKEEVEAETFIEKTWLKYKKNITEGKLVYVLSDNFSASQLAAAGDDQD